MQKGFDYLFEKTDQLPSELAEVVLGFNFTGGFTEVTNKFKLHLDQADILEDLTFRLMFGEIDSVTFINNLSRDLILPSGTAKEISDDVNDKIISPVKNALMKHIEEISEEYKDIELDESLLDDTPEPFHPKSAYNEPIIDEAPVVHHLPPVHESKLTHSEVLDGIENPHPAFINNSPIRTVSGSKSYVDVMGIRNKTTPVINKPPTVEVKPEPAPIPQPKIDPILVKSSSVVVSSPNKTETLPTKPELILPVSSNLKSTDPYKETIK